MVRPRIIPTLLLKGTGFVKTVKFRDPTYLGDCVNIIKIFNDKEVDEIMILDVTATPGGSEPKYDLLQRLATECFMPLGYGGGIRNIQQMRRLFQIGYEKVVVNSCAFSPPGLIQEAALNFGSQSIVVSIDVRRTWLKKYEVWTHCASKRTAMTPTDAALRAEESGAGELLLNSIDRDGTFSGYDLELVQAVASAVQIPVVACGGARAVRDLVEVIRTGGASAAAAGSMFVFHGPHRAVLINVPSPAEIDAAFGALVDR
jgi:imidazole glycerol-phosphate synthase subunit HisF